MKMKKIKVKIIKNSISILLAISLLLSVSPTGMAKVKPDKTKKKDITVNIAQGHNNNPEAAKWQEKKKKDNAKKNELIVIYKDDKNTKKNSSKNKVKNALGLEEVKVKKNFKNQKTEVLEFTDKDKSKGMHRIIDELKKDPNVEHVQPNYRLDINAIPADARYDEQWALNNIGAEIEGEVGRPGVDMSMQAAWDLETGSQDVVIGVLDTGIDITHEDLNNSIFINTNEIAGNGIDDDNNGYIDDINGWDFYSADNSVYDDMEQDLHGTQMAGIIAAEQNSTGISGVAPGIKLLPLKFIDGSSGYTCDAIEAIEYAIEMGVDIINCSFGGTDNNIALKEAIENSGILFICSAGNRGGELNDYPIYPAAFDSDNILSVASINNNGTRDIYSGYGSLVDIAAPGVNILTTYTENTYDYISGTSASTANATGVAALLKSYDNSLGIADIKSRILNFGVVASSLTDKVNSGSRIDAYGALSEVVPAEDTYTDPNEEEPLTPGGDGYDDDTWYTSDQYARIQEQIHYGSSGVSAASGNYSFTTNDMAMDAPGFKINISRSYNSKSLDGALLGKGWTFGFESWMEGESLVTVHLPKGGIERFRKQDDGSYEAETTRSSFQKNGDNTYTLTTKDQYKYHFGTNKYITRMEDRFGNYVDITVDADKKITKISDCVGRDFNVTYNSDDLIETVTDELGRVVTYNYTNKKLDEVIDVEGNVLTYEYDSYGYIVIVRDAYGNKLVDIEYDHNDGGGEHKVKRATDQRGSVAEYTYDKINRKTSITENGERTWTYWFDKEMYIIKEQDPEGKISETQYHLVGGKNKYGDIIYKKDRNGVFKEFDIDDRGNITKITTYAHGDETSKEFQYDSKNNTIMEKDEEGFCTYYAYDTEKKHLMKKAVPLNDKDAVYVMGTSNDNDFIITSYEYYTTNALLKSVTDPEGNKTTYTYDVYGNIEEVIRPLTDKTTSTYNILGWKTSTTTDSGYVTSFVYNNYGQVTKTTYHNGSVSRVYYDNNGRRETTVSPNVYKATYDTDAGYTGDNAESYEYDLKGLLEFVTDAMGYTTSYTYDLYGNKISKVLPDNSVYTYDYDMLNRISKEYFKEDINATPVLLKEYSYHTLSDNTTERTETIYINDTDTAVTTYIYNYAGKLIEQQNADGTVNKINYMANMTVDNSIDEMGNATYYNYDNANRIIGTWKPFEVKNGQLHYSYKGTEYFKNGQKRKETVFFDTVLSGVVPTATAENSMTTEYTYDANGNKKLVTGSGGKKTEYFYDSENRVERKETYTSATEKLVTEYVYDYAGRVLDEKVVGEAGAIYPNDITSTTPITLKTSYTYDNNGNMLTKTTPDNRVVTYEYDFKNNRTKTIVDGKDENDITVNDITTETIYDWSNKVLTVTDPMGHTTTNHYNKRGQLEKTSTQVTVNGLTENIISAKYYNRAGWLTAEVLPENYQDGLSLNQMTRIEYVYDSKGRLLCKKDIYKDEDNQWQTIFTKTMEYDRNGNLTKEIDPLGFEMTYTYNLANMQVSILDPESKERGLPYTSKTEFDAAGRTIKARNTEGVITENYYNEAGYIKKVTVRENILSPEEIISENTYDLTGKTLTSKDTNGGITEYEYNSFGQLEKTTMPADDNVGVYSVENQYDNMGRTVYQLDSNDKEIITAYDWAGRVSSRKEQKQGGTEAIETSTMYDIMSNARFETDVNGNTIEHTYDELGRKINSSYTVTDVNNISTVKTLKTTYNKSGQVIEEEDWLGNITKMDYDNLGRLIKTTDPLNKTIEILGYDDGSRQVSSKDALGNTTYFEYDKLGRVTRTIDPMGHDSKTVYDDVGNVQTSIDGNNMATTYDYDYLGRLLKVTNPLGETTRYTYSLSGNLLSQTNGEGFKTTYEYNIRGQVKKKTDPFPAEYEEYFTYYSDGSLKTKRDREGRLETCTYDIHGRLTEQNLDGDIITYTYDNAGNILTETNENGTTTREYDQEGRVIKKTVPDIGISKFEYDITTGMLTGEVAERSTDPLGNVKEKVFDRAGRLDSVKEGGNTTSYEYYDNGNKKKVIYPGSNTETYTYYDNNLLFELVNKKSNGTVIDSYSYTYDTANNQITKTDAKGTTTYTYDSLNRLKTVSEPIGRTTTYEFDKAGNRETETVSYGALSSQTAYSYDELNRLTGTVKTQSSITETTEYVYDKNGNMLKKRITTSKPYEIDLDTGIYAGIIGTDIQTDDTLFEYNKRNRLTRTTTKGSTSSYKYNASGQRVEKETDGTLTRYLYEGTKVVLEVDQNNTETARNIYGINLISRKANDPATGTPEQFYYMYNGHADVTALIKDNGDIEATYYYDAFGNHLEQTGNKDNPYRYSGYQYDKGTDLYYLNARYYDAKVARFLTEDTFSGMANDPLSLNRYTYCSNNPIKYLDPTGHWQQSDKYLSHHAQEYLLQYTDGYYNATTDEEREYYASQAKYVRDNLHLYEDGAFDDFYLDPGFYKAIETFYSENSVMDADTWFQLKGEYAPVGWGRKESNSIDAIEEDITKETTENNIELSPEETTELATNRAYTDTTTGEYSLSSDGYLRKINRIKEQQGARIAFQRIMNDIRKYYYEFHADNYENVRELYDLIDSLVAEIGTVDMDMHYFRNELNRVPKTLEDLYIENDNGNTWNLISVIGSSYHMQDTPGMDQGEGLYNVKLMSADGRFEAVYDKYGNLITEPINMGTYNYAPTAINVLTPINSASSGLAHVKYDVKPYKRFGNTLDSSQKGADNIKDATEHIPDSFANNLLIKGDPYKKEREHRNKIKERLENNK
jgi:RHS repeat-associated protein